AADALIAGALDAWEAGEAEAATPAPASAPRWPWLIAAGALLVAGGATAAWLAWPEETPPGETPREETPPEETPPPAPAAPEPAPPLPEVAPTPPRASMEIGEVRMEPEVDEVDEPEAPEARRPRRRPRPVAPAETPDDLLRRANDARRAARWREAERTYVEVTSAYPGTHAAYVAQVSAAALRLEHLGDARGALRLYRSAVRHGGALDADARHGLARAHRRLGQREREAEALEALVARHPGSPFAQAARRRLEELEAAR
ncbi:MAG TPA: tetratricopeptide repeat protein, partial [Polyangiaceae bacterium LLY-WYZ-15_(1-7)]|nr:tetratricopeptide repeat protein [Polyangiaceae bacterium LLY-WYZ-15_(1-7)]